MNDLEIAAAVKNVIALVDIARKDVLALDEILKVGTNGQPSILVNLDRLTVKVDLLETKLDELLNTCNSFSSTEEASNQAELVGELIKTNDKRISKLEKMLYIVTGVLGTFIAIITYGPKILKMIS